MELEFVEGIFVCVTMTVLFLVGYGIACLVGLAVMKLFGRRPIPKHRYTVGGVI